MDTNVFGEVLGVGMCRWDLIAGGLHSSGLYAFVFSVHRYWSGAGVSIV